jgi:hypothetical protein
VMMKIKKMKIHFFLLKKNHQHYDTEHQYW